MYMYMYVSACLYYVYKDECYTSGGSVGFSEVSELRVDPTERVE